MCRFIAYKGQPRLIDDIVIKPSNSLVQQSSHAKESIQHINADGLGLGWYNPTVDQTPAVFTSIQPAWNDKNLLDLARIIRTECFFAHIRAANSGDMSQLTCHPFRYKNFLFMHNGYISEFTQVKRTMIQLLSDDSYNWIRGQTDSEHLCALFFDKISQYPENYTAMDMGNALAQTINQLNEILISHDIHESSPVNIAITDGKYLVVSRYSTVANDSIHSLYYYTKEDSIIVASEKLNDHQDDQWNAVPINHLLIADENNNHQFMKL